MSGAEKNEGTSKKQSNYHLLIEISYIKQLFNIRLLFSASSEASLLVIVIDTNPYQNFIQDNPRLLVHCLDSVIAFANSHLMQKAQNKLAVLGCHQHKRYYLIYLIFVFKVMFLKLPPKHL